MFQINRVNPVRRETISDLRTPSSRRDQNKDQAIEQRPNEKKKKTKHSYFDWVQLIATICIPLIIAIYTVIEDQNNAANAEKTRQRDLDIASMSRTAEAEIAEANRMNELLIAEQGRQKDRELAADQQNQNILVEYQMFIAKLVLDYGANLSGKPEAKSTAQFMTLTVLSQLDHKRRAVVIRSLYFADLITFRSHADFNLQIGRGILVLQQVDLNNINFGLPVHVNEQLDRTQYILWDRLYLRYGYLTNASFRHTSLSCVTFINAIMDSADFSFANYHDPSCLLPVTYFQTSFAGASIINGSFYFAHFQFTEFASANMMFANLYGFSCWLCCFAGTQLYKANLSSTVMSHTPTVEHGRADFVMVNLTETVAYAAQFRFIDFNQSDWTNVQAERISVYNCTFAQAMMENCSFEKSTLHVTEFRNTSLVGLNIVGSTLTNVSFVYSNMNNANLSYVECDFCDFVNTTLDGASFINASFRNSNFFLAQISIKELFKARNLSGSILPNGTFV